MVAEAHFYREARYLSSARRLDQLPADEGAEAAFAGRSNSGKSSALNAIADQKALARISKTPGRTQMINLFELDAHCRLVDLPGYGYAKVPDSMRREWECELEKYLTLRDCLRGLILLMDVRHPLTALDVQMLEWCSAGSLPVHILLTKCDKLSRGRASTALRMVRKRIADHHHSVTAQLFSSRDGTGVEQARACLDHWLGKA